MVFHHASRENHEAGRVARHRDQGVRSLEGDFDGI
jgi:hypothetical protein